ncbi:MAG: ABC transporter permease, partial [Acidimicrobiales bacterium]
MNWLDTFRTGVAAIVSHRLRSALTMLGILIGIAAVILTVGLGEGAQAKVNSAINSLGTNLLIVSPGSTTTGTVRGGLGSASTLTVNDATALSNHTDLPDVAAVAPTVQRSMLLSAGSANWTTTVIGSTPPWLQVRGRHMAEGSFLANRDVTNGSAVVVLAPTTAQNLFGFRDPIGRSVDINAQPFTVVGVLTSAGSSANANEDDQAIVPITTAQQRLFGGATRSSVQSILI